MADDEAYAMDFKTPCRSALAVYDAGKAADSYWFRAKELWLTSTLSVREADLETVVYSKGGCVGDAYGSLTQMYCVSLNAHKTIEKGRKS